MASSFILTHNPSWGFGTGHFIGAGVAPVGLTTPHGDLERAAPSSRSAPSCFSQPLMGIWNDAANEGLNRTLLLTTPHGDLEPRGDPRPAAC